MANEYRPRRASTGSGASVQALPREAPRRPSPSPSVSSTNSSTIHGDVSRLSGFPQSRHFNFNFSSLDNPPSPTPIPTQNRRRSQSASSVLPLLPHAQPPSTSRPVSLARVPSFSRPLSVQAQRMSFAHHPLPIQTISEEDFPPPPYSKFVQRPPAAQRQSRRFSGAMPAPLTLDDVRSSPSLRTEAKKRQIPIPPLFGCCCARRQGPRIPMSSEKQARLAQRRKWYLMALAAGLVLITIILGAVMASQFREKVSNPDTEPSSDSSINGTSVAATELPESITIRPFRVAERLSTCVTRSNTWSCTLPEDTKYPTTNSTNENQRTPEFRFIIQKTSGIPVPRDVPNAEDYNAISSIDEVETIDDSPYTITLTTAISGLTSSKVDTDTSTIIPESHMLPPVISSQPLKLFNKGLPDEHYGFHIYFTKTIQFTNSTRVPASERDTGGVAAGEANYFVQWDTTRFKVSLYTKGDSTKPVEGGGDWELPVDIWEDRAGGFNRTKRVAFRAPQDDEKFGSLVESSGDERGCWCRWRNYGDS